MNRDALAMEILLRLIPELNGVPSLAPQFLVDKAFAIANAYFKKMAEERTV